MLRAPHKQHAPGPERIMKFPIQHPLRLFSEINEHVAANDQIHVARKRIREQVVLLKLDRLFQPFVYFIILAFFRKKLFLISSGNSTSDRSLYKPRRARASALSSMSVANTDTR